MVKESIDDRGWFFHCAGSRVMSWGPTIHQCFSPSSLEHLKEEVPQYSHLPDLTLQTASDPLAPCPSFGARARTPLQARLWGVCFQFGLATQRVKPLHLTSTGKVNAFHPAYEHMQIK